MDRYTHDRFPTVDTVTLKKSNPLLLSQFTSAYVPDCKFASGNYGVDVAKKKIGRVVNIGFVKGKEGKRVTLSCKSKRKARNHFALIEDCVPMPAQGTFWRHRQARFWVHVNGFDLGTCLLFVIDFCFVINFFFVPQCLLFCY